MTLQEIADIVMETFDHHNIPADYKISNTRLKIFVDNEVILYDRDDYALSRGGITMSLFHIIRKKERFCAK